MTTEERRRDREENRQIWSSSPAWGSHPNGRSEIFSDQRQRSAPGPRGGIHMSLKPGPFLKSDERLCRLARLSRTDVSLTMKSWLSADPLKADRFSQG